VGLRGGARSPRPRGPCPRAGAPDIGASKKVAAQTANRALEAFEAGRYEDAINGFQQADSAFHAPKFLLYIARAQQKLGRLIAAKATYEKIVAEKLARYAPQEFFDAQATARKELDDVTARIPSLRIESRGATFTVTLDGRPATLGKAFPIDPGEHTIVGTAAGLTEVRRKVVLQERETRTETLEALASTTTPTPSASEAATASSAVPDTERPPRRGIPTITIVAYGVGAAGLVTGVLFGGLTLAKKGEFDASPTAETADLGQAFSHVADVGFGLALAGAAVGTVVWVLSSRSGPARPPATSLFIAPRAGGLTIGGAF
jgi:hypothetical protein